MKILFFLSLINAFAYYIMYNDKQRAKRKAWRIREAHLFLLAVLGGGLGIWLGTKAPIFHKSAHWQFRIGVPLIMLGQAVLAFLFWK